MSKKIKIMISLVGTLILLFCLKTSGYSNTEEEKVTPTATKQIEGQTKQMPEKDGYINTPPISTNSSIEGNLMSSYEMILSILVIVLGIVVILAEFLLIKNKNLSGDEAIRFVTITLIIIASVFLITAGYNNNQIAPVMGLLGTIAGYLLGKSTKETKQPETSK